MFNFLNDQNLFDNPVAVDDTSKQDDKIPQFRCMGKVSFAEDTFHPDGYVCSGELDRLMSNQDMHRTQEETVRLFGRCFAYEEAFINDNKLLLKLARNAYERLEHSARGNQVTAGSNNSLALRQSIIHFMSYLKTYTDRFLTEFGRFEELISFYDNLTATIERIDGWSGNIDDMPPIVFNSGSLMNNGSTVAVLLHTYLDIKWSLVELAFMVAHLRQYDDSGRPIRDRFRAVVLERLESNLCADLLVLAIRRFHEVSANDWIGTTPFTCTCARELWLMLMTIRVKSDHSLFTFVVQRYSTLTESTSTRSHPTASFAETKKLKILSKDPLALVWLLVHLSRLGGFNQTGTWDKKFSRIEGDYDVINKLVQLYLNGTETLVTEERTRALMACLYSLSHVWGANLNICITLWEFFHKKLDDHSGQMSSFDALPYSSSLSWYDQLTTASVEPWKVVHGRHTSYFIFLRLLGYHMELMNAKSQASFKARLYVKLQGKKIQELSLLGLYHMLSACLTIVIMSESSDDMVSKILEMSSDNKNKSIFFAAEMVLLLIGVRRGRDWRQVALSIASNLEIVSSGLKNSDPKVREEQRKRGSMFVELFQEVIFQSQQFTSGLVLLIGQSLRSYLSNCGSCDRSVVIDSLSKLMEKQRNCPEVYTAIMNFIYPLMKEKFAIIEHLSFFVQVTIICLEMNGNEFENVFHFFCLDEKISPRMSLKYVSKLLESSQFLVNLSLSVDNYQSILIQTWFRISFIVPPIGDLADDIDRLNSVVRRLPRMAEMTVQSRMNPMECSRDVMLQLMMNLSTSYQNIQNFSERACVRETYLQYIGPLDKYLNGCIAAGDFWEDADQVSHVLRLASQLFYHCGNIIYIKGKIDCLLAQLNNVLLIPLQLTDLGKELPVAATTSLQQHLPRFMFGLVRLNPSRDGYVVRCLNTVFQSYMTRFAPNHSHPFTRCWIGLESEPVSNALVPVMRSWLLQTVSTSVLPPKIAKTSPYLQSTLQWLKFLMTNGEWKLDICRSIALPIFELSLILDEMSHKKSVTDILQSTVVCSADTQLSEIIERGLNELVGRHLAFNSNRLFKLIEVISMINAELVRRALPNIRQQVAITETKRGTGADSILRHHLATLEISLEHSSK